MSQPRRDEGSGQDEQHLAFDLTRETAQRQQVESALRDNALEYHSVVEVLSEGITVIQADGAISFLNESAAHLVGSTREFLLDQRLLDLRWNAIREDGSRLPHAEHPSLVTLRTGEPIRGFVMGLHLPDDSWRWLSVNTYPLKRFSEVSPYAVAASFTDITARLEHERAMQESYDALDKLTNQFMSMVSHELRTPLTSIHGSLKLLDSGVFAELPPQAHSLLGVAQSNTERLMRIINDILDLEQLESGRMAFRAAELDPALLIQEVVDTLRDTAASKHINIVTNVALPQTLCLDHDRLFRVLEHLLSNALKFSFDEREIHIKAMEPQPGWVRFEVTDYGIGILPDQLKRLFEKFTQADPSDRRNAGGTGLGLAIARSTVEHMGGRIGVESQQQVQTCFWFEIPSTIE